MAFKTRMVWRSVGAGHWDVELVQLIDGRAALLATLSLDEWVDLGATQYVAQVSCRSLGRSVVGRALRRGARDGLQRLIALVRCCGAPNSQVRPQ